MSIALAVQEEIQMTVLPMYVVILNWNLYAETVDCIESILVGKMEGVKLIVVDNGSEDGSAERLATRFGSAIEIIRNERNEGFARGNNIGIQYALEQGAESVLILNNDTVVDPETISVLLEALEADQGVHILGPAIYYADAPNEVWRLGDRYLPRVSLPRSVSPRELNRDVIAIPVDLLTGCAMLVRRAVFEKVGLFDSHYPFYFEDADFCERARRAGFDLACIPKARLWHKVSRSADRVSLQSSYNQARGRVVFYRQLQRRLVGKGIVYSYLAVKTLSVVVSYLLKRRFDLARASIRGARDGFQVG